MLFKTGAPPVAQGEPGEHVLPVSNERHARCEMVLSARLHGPPPLFPIALYTQDRCESSWQATAAEGNQRNRTDNHAHGVSAVRPICVLRIGLGE